MLAGSGVGWHQRTSLRELPSPLLIGTLFAVYPLCCSLALLGFALRDSPLRAQKAGAARTRGFTLAGGLPESVAAAAPGDPDRR